MRSTVNLITRTIALCVVFVLGFGMFAGFMLGGGYLVYTKISIDALEEMGLIDFDADSYFSEDAEVPVQPMTLQNLVSELQHLLSVKDEISITMLIERYGLKIEDDIAPYLTKKYRDMPLINLLNGETITEIATGTLIGDLYGYERIKNPEYNAETDEGNRYIWRGDNGEELNGIIAVISSYSVIELIGNPEGVMNKICIADALGLVKADGIPVYIVEENALGETVRTDVTAGMGEQVVWLDNNGFAVDNMVAAIAPLSLGDVESSIDSLSVGDLTGIVSYSDKWYSRSYDAENKCVLLTPTNDVSADIAHVTIRQISSGELSDAAKDIRLSAILGYTEGEDGWYSDGTKVSGIMSVIAPYRVGELGTKVGTLKVGEIAGYSYDDELGWYELDSDGNKIPATGILANLSDLTVDDVSDESKLSDKIQAVNVSDILGYTKGADGKWYMEGSDGELQPVTGIMSIIAGTPISGVEAEIKKSEMGNILGYTELKEPIYDEFGNPALDPEGNQIYKTTWLNDSGEEVHVLMQKIASTNFSEVGTVTDTLTVADLIPPEERESGYISLINAEETTLDSLPAEVDRVFQQTSMKKFIEKDIITFEDDTDGSKKDQVLSLFEEGGIYYDPARPEGLTISEFLLMISNPFGG